MFSSDRTLISASAAPHGGGGVGGHGTAESRLPQMDRASPWKEHYAVTVLAERAWVEGPDRSTKSPRYGATLHKNESTAARLGARSAFRGGYDEVGVCNV